MSTKAKLIFALIGIVACIVAFVLYPKEFLFTFVVLFLLVVFFVSMRKRARSPRSTRRMGSDYGRYGIEDDQEPLGGDMDIYVHRKRRIPCPNPHCRNGWVEKPMMPIQRGALRPKRERCRECEGEGFIEVWD